MPKAEQGPGREGPLQRIVAVIGRIRGRDIPTPEDLTPEDRVWNQYMDVRWDWPELVALVVNGQIQSEYQQRAIEILLAPDILRLPFHVNVDAGSHTYTHVSRHWIENISGAQASFIAEKIPEYIQQAGEAMQRSKHDNNAGTILATYNSLIPHLLGKLPPEQAERLFENFSINDLEPSWQFDFVPGYKGYNPLKALCRDRTVDESWKRRAVDQMHVVMKREQMGGARPCLEHETAVSNYCEILEEMLYINNGLPTSREFYQDEIAFMLGLETGRPIVRPSYTGQVLDLLDDADLRHRFARRQVLTGKTDHEIDLFKIYGDAGVEVARRIIGEFPEDGELVTYLEQQLQEWQVRFEQERQQSEEERRASEQAAIREQAILEEMKEPVFPN